MKLGQTTLVVFVSKFVGSILGFLATFYFAQTLGPSVFGTYTVVIALIFWLELAGSMGISSAVTKRLSEGEERESYLAAGTIATVALGVLVMVGIVAARGYVNEYVGTPVAQFVVLLLGVRLFYSLVNATLTGQRLVHVAGICQSLKIATRSLVQIGLVLAGWSLTGLFLGYATGGFVIGTVGLLLASTTLRRPKREHFHRLVEYAKYSWLGQLQTRSFNEVDILVLNAFVSPALVGIYAVAWSVANFLTLFGNAVSNTLFPEISRVSAQKNEDAVAELVERGLAYGGLILIPGLVGGAILADRLLRIYGGEFVRGTAVLGLLILACLFYAYQQQLLTAINAIDRPNLSFKINGAFILTNTGLNVALVSQFGWVGAAVATVVSTALGLTLSYVLFTRLVSIHPPIQEIKHQVLAASLMGVVLWLLRRFIDTSAASLWNVALTVGLVVFGAGLYFLGLLGLSAQFRRTVTANLPIDELRSN